MKKALISIRTRCFALLLLAAGFSALSLRAAWCAGPHRSAELSPPSSQAEIPAVFFGLTVQDFQRVAPAVPFATTRTWDAFAGSWDSYPGLDWPHISPSRGVYNFSALDRFLAINRARGSEVIYTFGRTPRWASSSPDAPGAYGPGQCAPSAQMQDWDDFVTAIAKHVRGRIRYWELWNEPNDAESYCGGMAAMVEMAHRAASILKAIDPSAKLLSPGVTSERGPAWLDAFLSSGGGAWVDILAFHGYWSATAEDIDPVIARYRGVAASHGVEGKPLWDTEASWAGRNGGKGELVGASERAAFLAKYYLLQWSAGVSRVVWYAYDGRSIWGQLWDPVTGLHADGVAYRETYRWMAGATMLSPCTLGGNEIWSCALSRPGDYRAMAVWNSKGQAIFPVPPGYTEYRDLEGGRHAIRGHRIAVGNQPILLETRPISGSAGGSGAVR